MFLTVLTLVSFIGFIPQGADENNKPPASKPSTPAEQYQVLVKEFQAAFAEQQRILIQNGSQIGNKARNKDETYKLLEKEVSKFLENRPQARFAGRFLDLAVKYPEDPVAVDALAWVIANHQQSTQADRALEILATDHIQSAKLTEVCLRLIISRRSSAEKFLRTVLEDSPHREVKGHAGYALAEHLRRRSSATSPADVGLAKKAETFYDLTTKEYGDIKAIEGGAERTLAQKIAAERFERDHLELGKVAPNLEGEDADGKPMQLSDYRGKVVVLDFWGHW